MGWCCACLKLQYPTFGRTAVLRRLGHVSGEGVVTLKGRAAGCISTGVILSTFEQWIECSEALARAGAVLACNNGTLSAAGRRCCGGWGT